LNRLFLTAEIQQYKSSSKIKRVMEEEDYTNFFILVHSSSRATSIHLHNNAKISTIPFKFTYKTHSRPNLEPYKMVSTPCAAPYHTRCTILGQMELPTVVLYANNTI